MNKAPAFQFYAKDWLSSSRVALMTLEQEGAYIRLLAYAWDDADCSIPDDDTQLATLSRFGERWLNDGSTVLRQMFVSHPTKPGRLINERLFRERESQRRRREANRQSGIASGKSRRKAKALVANDRSTNEQPNIGSGVGNSLNSSTASASATASTNNVQQSSCRNIRTVPDKHAKPPSSSGLALSLPPLLAVPECFRALSALEHFWVSKGKPIHPAGWETICTDLHSEGCTPERFLEAVHYTMQATNETKRFLAPRQAEGAPPRSKFGANARDAVPASDQNFLDVDPDFFIRTS